MDKNILWFIILSRSCMFAKNSKKFDKKREIFNKRLVFWRKLYRKT